LVEGGQDNPNTHAAKATEGMEMEVKPGARKMNGGGVYFVHAE